MRRALLALVVAFSMVSFSTPTYATGCDTWRELTANSTDDELLQLLQDETARDMVVWCNLIPHKQDTPTPEPREDPA